MTADEFKAELEKDLWPWLSKTERPLRSWVYSVEIWCQERLASERSKS